MDLVADSIPERTRRRVLHVAALFAAFAVLQCFEPAMSVTVRVATAAAYLLSAIALLRDWPQSRNMALVLIVILVLSTTLQIAISLLHLVPPSNATVHYASLALCVVLLAVALPGLMWLWRDND
jgi:hypothetical protein